MPRSILRTLLMTAVIVLAIAGTEHRALQFAATAWSQETPPKPDTPTDPESVKKLIERLNKLENEVDLLKKGDATGQPATDGQVLPMLDVAHLGLFYPGPTQTRYLVLHVMLFNTTKQAYTITRDNVVAEIDGEERKLRDISPQLQNYQIPYGRQSLLLSSLKPPKEWRLPPNGQSELWLIYPELPLGPNVPKCKLKIALGNTTKEINVNEMQRAQLGLDVQRIGPRKCLALLTISGKMSFFNTGALVDELEKMVDQKVSRVVVTWGDGATPPDQQIMQWLQVAAAGNTGNQNSNQLFPVIPAAIREFHLTEFPVSDDNPARNNYGLRPTNQTHIHKTTAESVGSALRTAYLALPRDELLEEIRAGNPLTRAAALAYGGGRLTAEFLPQIFQWAEDQDPEIQKAAIQTLSHYGEAEAVEKLVQFARRNTEPLSSEAIESLAGSRFGSAHDALLNLLKNEPPASKKKIVQVLAKYPRPIWSSTLYEFVTASPEGMDADSLKALVQVGHPELVDVLERALKSSDRTIREEGFKELAKRSDERSETLALDYALKQLETSPPDMTIVQLLSRTKDQRAVPLLLKQLDAIGGRVNTINLLMQLGDISIADKLVAKYASLDSNEKVQVLQGLKLFRHPKFRELCGDALLTNDNQLVTAAATALWQEGHADGEKLLINALEKQRSAHVLGNIANALANFGTPTARAALVKAKESGDSTKRSAANQALAMLQQRSPGYTYIYQAQNYYANKLIKEALEAYTTSLQLDPSLPDAYFGRAQIFLEQEKFGDARKDLEKVIELKYDFVNGRFGDFVTSLAIARIGEGQLTEGLKYLEENRVKGLQNEKEHVRRTEKGRFNYNAACAYSRAVEQVEKQKDLADRDQLRVKYRKQALEDLEESFKQGFSDYDWATKDPDLKILRDDPEFKRIIANKPSDKLDSKKPNDEE